MPPTPETREQYIEHNRRYCHHYGGRRIILGDGKCGCGIDVRAKFGALAAEWPCLQVELDKRCPVALQRSDQAIGADFDDARKAAAQVLTALPEIHIWAVAQPLGKTDTIVCPICKNNLHLIKQHSNGHIWAKCETPKCVEFIS